MEHDHDFSALRQLLACQRLELPADTGVNRFLIEFHRRQRAQLLVPESRWKFAFAWMREAIRGFRVAPPLSYASGFAALAFLAFLGLTQQVQVTNTDGGYKLSLHMPSSDATLAMIPASFTRSSPGTASKTDPLTFTSQAKPAPTRFILTNSQVAYDATVAF